MTTREIRQAIKDYYASIPGAEVLTGRYLKVVGRKIETGMER